MIIRNPLLHLVLILTLSLQIVAAQDAVSITQTKTGKSISVEVIGVASGILTFKMSGKEFKIPVSQLTPDSVQRLRDHLAKAPAPAAAGKPPKASADFIAKATAANDIIGHELFGTSSSIWSEDSADVSERLKWKLESRKKNTSSYRLYTKLDYTFLGAHPYCVTLYGGENNLTERLSLVFANKGDFGSRLGMGEDHFKKIHPERKAPGNLDEAIEIDEEVIANSLTKAFGDPKQQYYGEKEDKRKVKRWDLGEQAFLLSSLEGEYTNLVIVPTSNADAQGKVERINDSDFKKIQITNVTQNENGDVWVENIPMVNQGPKGYCAPATFERAMRYMGIPADMYLLATAATSAGGGTNTTKLSEDCKRIVRSKARRIRELDLNEDFEIKKLKKYIDKGVPILWQMCSLKSYNDIANKRSKERASVTDFAKWTADIQAEADSSKSSLRKKDNYHICMVIGYNEATREVAVSDSWGPKYEIRWVHEEIAKAVTSQGGFVIDF